MRCGDLADALRRDGLPVIEVAGWRGRGAALNAVNAVVLHHTATGVTWSDQRVADLLRDGRPDCPGPLAQLGLDRRGRYWLVADGRANHNGYGLWGNQSVGIEAYHSGTAAEPWARVQLDAFVRGARVVCRLYGLPYSRALGHRETDPARKPDPIGIDLPAFRAAMAALDQEGLFMVLSPSQQHEMYEWLRVLMQGVPAYGVRPVHTSVSRIARAVDALGDELEMGRDGLGEIAPAEPARRTGARVRHTLGDVRRIGHRVGAQGMSHTADPPQAPLVPGTVDVEDLAMAVAAVITAELRQHPVDAEAIAERVLQRLAERLAG